MKMAEVVWILIIGICSFGLREATSDLTASGRNSTDSSTGTTSTVVSDHGGGVNVTGAASDTVAAIDPGKPRNGTTADPGIGKGNHTTLVSLGLNDTTGGSNKTGGKANDTVGNKTSTSNVGRSAGEVSKGNATSDVKASVNAGGVGTTNATTDKGEADTPASVTGEKPSLADNKGNATDNARNTSVVVTGNATETGTGTGNGTTTENTTTVVTTTTAPEGVKVPSGSKKSGMDLVDRILAILAGLDTPRDTGTGRGTSSGKGSGKSVVRIDTPRDNGNGRGNSSGKGTGKSVVNETKPAEVSVLLKFEGKVEPYVDPLLECVQLPVRVQNEKNIIVETIPGYCQLEFRFSAKKRTIRRKVRTIPKDQSRSVKDYGILIGGNPAPPDQSEAAINRTALVCPILPGRFQPGQLIIFTTPGVCKIVVTFYKPTGDPTKDIKLPTVKFETHEAV